MKTPPCSGWILAGLTGSVAGKEFLLPGHKIRIGRTPDNDIQVESGNISRHHVSLEARGEGLWAEDLGSKNGTYLNGRLVGQGRLDPGDRMKIGDADFEIRHEITDPSAVDTEPSRELRLSRTPSAAAGFIERVGMKRVVLYGTALLVLIVFVGSAAVKRSRSVKFRAPKPRAESFSVPHEVPRPEPASEEEVLTWGAQAEKALRYDDVAAAIPLLKRIAAARPEDPAALKELERAEIRLASLIARYYENGVREFEKLYFDRAIAEWRKVLAYASGFDPETFRKAEEKIAEARAKLAKPR